MVDQRLALGVIAVLLTLLFGYGVGAVFNAQIQTIVEDQKADLTPNSVAYNSTVDLQDAAATTASKAPTTANIMIAGLIITILLVAFGGFVGYRMRA